MNPLFYTENKNTYYYHNNNKSLFYIHPVLSLIIHLEKAGKNIDIETLITEYPQIPIEELEYYQKKHVYLKKFAGIKKTQQKKVEFKRYTSNDITRYLTDSSQLVFEVTTKCNMKCVYCAYGECYDNLEYSPNDTLTFAKAKNVIDYLFNLWNSKSYTSFNKTHNIGFYGGEALLNIQLIEEIVNYANSKAMNSSIIIKYSMTTNAVLLDKNMDFLVKHDFQLLISLDGNEENNVYRILKNNSPSYPIIIANIQQLKKRYPLFFENNVSFNAVLHNKNSANDVYSFFDKKFNKRPHIGELTSSEINKNKMEQFYEMYRSLSHELTPQEQDDYFETSPIIRSLFSFLYYYSGVIYKDYYSFLMKHHQKETLVQSGTCSPFTKKIYISCDGKILPCEKVSHKYALGEVTDSNIHVDTTMIANKYNQLLEKINHQCSKCHSKKICGKCLFYIDQIDSKSPKCDAYSNKEKFYYTFGKLISILEYTPSIYENILKVKLS